MPKCMTTTLKNLSSFIPSDEPIIVIEDISELVAYKE
ncbi:type II secretion system protein E [Desulforamulus ruminis DSM 2154]|uniref:Type II secretion system protein E n=1 Tax=Desulforamulus ruminis (strain ATCC 23193 / DSM 2154 / NCIMB 8452 / DL) TaxID=696281 RepID=F6DQ41_DESRL|nr:type II secretion system protein E [Desulforamulus ruminis DSM 2154]